MIAAYQRISRADGDLGKDGKDKSNSIENQKELIQRYISCKESLQNVPVMDFVDDGYTGSNFDRPGFQQMMDGVRNGKIDTIIVKDLSRFGRDYIGVGEYMEQIFPLLGVRLIAINDNYDSNNYKGTTLGMDVVVSNLVNTMYCRDAGKKLRTANQVKWRKGITTASAAPFGYQFDPDKKGAFIIDLPAAKIVRRIFDLAILGLGTREIAMMLNDENVPVPSVWNGEDGLPIPPYAVYNIGNQNPENLLDFVQILSEELVRAKVLPEDYDFEAHKELVPMQPGDVPVTYADTSALERDFGYKPSTSLREGLRKFAEWYAKFYK